MFLLRYQFEFCLFFGGFFRLYCLEHIDGSLKQNLEVLLDLAYQTTFPNDRLCTFLRMGCNNATRAQLLNLLEGASLTVEWVLVSCGSSFTVDDVSSPTPNPVPSQNPTVGIKHFEPTRDFKPSLNREPLHLIEGALNCRAMRRTPPTLLSLRALAAPLSDLQSNISLSSVPSVPPCLPLTPPQQTILEGLALIFGL